MSRLSRYASRAAPLRHQHTWAPISTTNAFITRAPNEQVQAYLQSTQSPPGNTPHPDLSGRLIAVKDNICTTDLPTTCGSKILAGFLSPFDATVVSEIRRHGGFIVGKTNLDEFGMGSHSVNSAYGAVSRPSRTTQKPKQENEDEAEVERLTEDLVSADVDGEAEAGTERYSAGGSSGGSAAAVAEGSCTMALGTDTGGSVRLPAAFCGVVGFKPSYGRVSRYGVVAYANSLDTVGILGRSVEDVHWLYHAVTDPDEKDPTCLGDASRGRITQAVKTAELNRAKRPLRIGVPVEYRVQMDETVKEAWAATLEMLRTSTELRFELVPVSLPSTKPSLAAYYVLAPAEAASNLAKYDGVRYGSSSPSGPRTAADVLYAAVRSGNLGPEVRRRITLGSYSLSSTAIDNYFIQAQQVRRLVQQDFNETFAMAHPLLEAGAKISDDLTTRGVDLLLTPTAPRVAPTLREVEGMDAVTAYGYDVFTVPASLAGLPAVSVPVGGGDNATAAGGSGGPGGGSVGMQLIGQYGDDDFVLDIAHVLQEATARQE